MRNKFQKWLVIVALFLLVILVALLMLKKFGILASTNDNDTVVFPEGYSYITGKDLAEIDWSVVQKKDLEVFSFNDPNWPIEDWTLFTGKCGNANFNIPISKYKFTHCLYSPSTNFDTRLGYVMINNGKKFNLKKIRKVSDTATNLPAGKHLTYWKQKNSKVLAFREALKFTFSDKSTLSFADSWKSGAISGHIGVISASSSTGGSPAIVTDLVLPGHGNTIIKTGTFFLIDVQKNHNVTAINIDKTQIDNEYSNPPLQLGTNLSPSNISQIINKGINIYDDIKTIGLNFVRFINFDLTSNNQINNDTEEALKLKESAGNLSGNFTLLGSISPERNFPVDQIAFKNQSNKTEGQYNHYSEVVDDIRLYSGYSNIQPDDKATRVTPDWDKLKKLIEYHYFRGCVIPKLEAYSGSIKNWQIWNEPDGALYDSKFAIPAEALALMTTGKVYDATGKLLTEFGDRPITVNGKEYNLQHGAGGIVADSNKKGIIKQVCADCSVVSAGFFRSRENTDYYDILKASKYEQSVEINEVHLNLHPASTAGVSMGYTRYWDDYYRITGIYNKLCGGIEKCKKPLWSTEIGSPSDTIFKDNLTNPKFTMSFTREFQADDLIKRFISLAGFGFSNLSWNGYYSETSTDCQKSILNGTLVVTATTSLCAHQQKALYYKSGNTLLPKPSYSAYQTVSNILKGAKSVELLNNIDKTHQTANQTFIYMITETDGSKTYVAWCDPFWDKNGAIEGDWNYNSASCSSNISLQDYDMLGQVNTTDKDGKKTTENSKQISVTKSPVIIENLNQE